MMYDMTTVSNYNNFCAFDESLFFPTQCDFDFVNGLVDSASDLLSGMCEYKSVSPYKWTPYHFFDWLTVTAMDLGVNYETFINARNYSHVDGNSLQHMTLEHFSDLTNSRETGLKIYQAKQQLFGFSNIPTIIQSTVCSPNNNTSEQAKRKRGRPPKQENFENGISKPKDKPFGKIWEFVAKLLADKNTCPSLIKWDDYTMGTFKFVQPKKVAELWGQRKNNKKMDYNKFTRALRYHYKKGFLESVEEKRLVYKFGPKAKELQNKFPNNIIS